MHLLIAVDFMMCNKKCDTEVQICFCLFACICLWRQYMNKTVLQSGEQIRIGVISQRDINKTAINKNK